MATSTVSSPQAPPPPYSPKDNTLSSQPVTTLTTVSAHSNESELVSAAQTLTQLNRNSTPPSDADTIITDDQTDLPQEQQQQQPEQQRHPIVSTVSMVARHPIVLNAVKYYEDSKRNYPSFNYAAGIVESATIPVVNNIETKLNARHQSRQAAAISSSNDLTPTNSSTFGGDNKIQYGGNKKRRFSNTSQTSQGTTVDTKKRLQFCINILKLANQNINSKVEFLHDKINETEIAVKEEREKLYAQRSNDSTTQKTKTEIVGTVKKIIHLISNFRPSSLGDTTTSTTNSLTPVSSNNSHTSNTTQQDLELKNAIRDIILSLPQSLQQQQEQQNGGSQDDVIFKFAKESLVMISRLTQIFTDKLDQVDAWVNGDETMKDVAAQQEQKLKSEGNDDDEEEENLAAETKRMKIDESR
ncbi:hypothetical protein SBY92_001713 [Candida maltosa Xu316]|uniref:Uncharacterized protein n=1 Tax=Candida maltosa (strain Xu316) TaxID=1245528 RepID=M3JFB2_CANMX|nr:hypothetical protein G210_5768 [Candida maltosa Xu316]